MTVGAGLASLRYRRADGGVVESRLDRVAVDDLINGMPVREFRWYRGRRHYSGWYWAATVSGLVAYESRLELARILLADFDPAVIGIAAQPFQLVGEDGGKLRRHVPDLLLRHESGVVTVVDVKPAHRVDDSQVAAVFAWTAELVGSRGWGFEVWSGADAGLLANVGFLAGYRRSTVVDQTLISLVVALAAEQETVGGLEEALAAHVPAVLSRPVLLHLVWSGRIRADLSRPLGSQTRIWSSAGAAR